MDHFKLDSRLANDCLVLGELKISLLLLVNNSLLPWFILVPKTSAKEVTDLSRSDQDALLDEVNLLAAFVKTNFSIAKLNIAAIGNIVSQLHIHVVWGSKEREPYTAEMIDEITASVNEQLVGKLK